MHFLHDAQHSDHRPRQLVGLRHMFELLKARKPIPSLLLVLVFLAGTFFWLAPNVMEHQGQGHHSLRVPQQIPLGFNYNKVITVVAFDRFEYFRQTMNALWQAFGASEYSVIVTIDGSPAESGRFDKAGWENIIAYSRQLEWLAQAGQGFKSVLVNVSDVNLGVWPNKKRAVTGAFTMSDFVVVMEDDIVVDRDALRWFEWHVESGYIFDHPEVALSTCWSYSFPYDAKSIEPYDLAAVTSLGLLDKFVWSWWHTPWGWATWRRTWDGVGEEWTGRDRSLLEAVKKRGWFETVPLVARCNNVGARGVNKKGLTKGAIQLKSLTSSFFSGLDKCQYTDLQRKDPKADGIDSMDLYSLVRHGTNPRECDVCKSSLKEYVSKLRNLTVQDVRLPLGTSSC